MFILHRRVELGGADGLQGKRAVVDLLKFSVNGESEVAV